MARGKWTVKRVYGWYGYERSAPETGQHRYVAQATQGDCARLAGAKAPHQLTALSLATDPSEIALALAKPGTVIRIETQRTVS